MHISDKPRIQTQSYNYGKRTRSQNSKQSRATAYASSQCPAQQLSHINNFLSVENQKLADKYEKENQLNTNLVDYSRHNAHYHEGLKLRNAHLNNTVNALVASKLVMANTMEVAQQRSAYQKDDLLRCCSMQSNQLTHTKRMISSLMDSKSMLHSRMQSIGFELEQQADAHGLQTHEMAVRAQGMHINMARALSANNTIIQEMKQTIEAYDRQNKDLRQQIEEYKLMKLEVELNKQYGRTKQAKQNSLNAQNNKQQYMQRIVQLEQVVQQLKDYNQHLQQSINDNKQIITIKDKQLQQMKKNIKQKQDDEQQRRMAEKQASKKRSSNKLKLQREQAQVQEENEERVHEEQINKQLTINRNIILFQLAKGEGLVSSVISLRNGINREVFEIFITSVEKGDQAKTNCLSIFLQRWKTIEIQRIEPYVQAYMEARTALTQYYNSHKSQSSSPEHQQLLLKIKQTLPILLSEQKPSQLPHDLTYKSPLVYKTYASELHKQNVQNRSKINVWILNTIQFTINQREVAAKDMKSELLYLFRMLTIQYRVAYPAKGQQYVMDADVRNCLLDYTVGAVWNIIRIK